MDVGGILYSRQMEAFLNAVAGKQPTNLESAVYVQKVIEKIYLSAEQEKIVSVD